AVATARDTVDGSGTPATEERDIGYVSGVVLAGSGDLTIEPGPFPALSVTADDNILPALETDTVDGKLTLRPKSRTTLRPKTKITSTLPVPSLDAITVSGAGNVQARRLDAKELVVKLSGSGNLHLNNLTCKAVTLTLSGAGTAHLSGT